MKLQNYFILNHSKEITKKVYNSLINTVKKVETIFMNTESSKSNEAYRLKLHLSDRTDLKNPKKNVVFLYRSILYPWKSIKNVYNKKTFKISASKWSDELSLNYVMDHILLKAFKITLCISLKNMKL